MVSRGVYHPSPAFLSLSLCLFTLCLKDYAKIARRVVCLDDASFGKAELEEDDEVGGHEAEDLRQRDKNVRNSFELGREDKIIDQSVED